jgi:hypothetical protein
MAGEALKDLVDRERALYMQMADLESRQAELRRLIKDELVKAGLEKAEVGKWACTIVSPRPSERLNKGKLVAAGVTPDQLKAGTTVTPRDPYLMIRPADKEL